MSETASISLSIAGRYAQALFELAKEDGALKALDSDADALGAVLTESPELAAMIASPVVGRDEQSAAMAAVAAQMGLSTLTQNTLALMAQKRRLFILPQLVQDLKARIAKEKGEVTAEVTSAAVLTAGQRDALVADASGDRLDAVLCLLQAAWARAQPAFGRPAHADALEGWIVSA